MASYNEGDPVTITLPSHKSLSDYQVGSEKPLFAGAAKAVIGRWRVTGYYKADNGTVTIEGEVVSVVNPYKNS